jgi:hypothetical protein
VALKSTGEKLFVPPGEMAVMPSTAVQAGDAANFISIVPSRSNDVWNRVRRGESNTWNIAPGHREGVRRRSDVDAAAGRRIEIAKNGPTRGEPVSIRPRFSPCSRCLPRRR